MTQIKPIREDINKFSKLVAPKGDINAILGAELGKRFYDYRERWERASVFKERTEFPLHIGFEFNASCNLKCPMCTWSAESVIPGKDFWMDFDFFKKIIDEGVEHGLSAVGFDWVNEPLIRKDLPKFVAYARDAGVIDLIIHTNGTLLTKSMSERLIDAGLTRMMVSLDALTQETYDQIRVGSNMGKVVKNVHQFLEARTQRGSRLPLLSVNFVLMSLNEHELKEFVEHWTEYVDFFSIQQYISPFGNSSGDKVLHFANSRELVKDFRCQQPWQRMTVRYDGRVLPCCTFFAEKLVIGDARTQTIKEIWDSPQMRDLQDMHANGEYFNNPVCKECAENSVVDMEASDIASIQTKKA